MYLPSSDSQYYLRPTLPVLAEVPGLAGLPCNYILGVGQQDGDHQLEVSYHYVTIY